MSRPRPTHFVCLPLVGPASAPQLATSLSHFWERASTIQPALPKAALRPLGTLHFTLGVMDLSDRRRLEEAVAFLNNMDLAGMLNRVEAEQRTSASAGTVEVITEHTSLESRGAADMQSITVQKIEGRAVVNDSRAAGGDSAQAIQGHGQSESPGEKLSHEPKTSNPLTISLVSLGSLPSVKEARILYAEPLDLSSRLYPFAQAIQQQFIQAGFMQQDLVRETAGGRRPQLVPRPLLLHATVANTIYAPKKWSKPTASRNNNNNNDKRGNAPKPKKESQKFDATSLLAEFAGSKNDSEHQKGKPAYVWAEQLPIDRLCICEMGAKPVANESYASTGGPVLESEYRIVAERRLQF
ncbi:hypothetical protein KEM56_006581 [Ascosphaera pollenicola]|nr:hypothetical protein KEM56_006581 [Ascosphaera pollenicola]